MSECLRIGASRNVRSAGGSIHGFDFRPGVECSVNGSMFCI